MKKIIILLFFVVVITVGINEKEKILIPKESIRFRIIANSNSIADQKLKIEIKNKVEKELYNIIGDANNIEVAREKINNNIAKIDNLVKDYNIEYDINYGNNFFPTKEYKGIKYSQGNYESLVITLGSGKGNNWWCVLFPPLCLLDENESLDDVEYEWYVKKLINKSQSK